MRYSKYLYTLIPLVAYVFIYVVFILWIGEETTLYKYKSDIFKGGSTITAALMAAIGVILTIENNQNLKNKELLNDLDQKSEWRKELMNIAAKPVMQLEDVYRILASLRFLPKSKVEIEGEESEQQEEQETNREQQEKQDERQLNEEGKKGGKDKDNRKGGSDQKEFDVISNYIYKKLNTMLNNSLGDFSVDETLTDEALKRTFTIRKSEEIRLYTKFLLKHHWEYNKSEKDKDAFKEKEMTEFLKVIKEIKRLEEINMIKSQSFYLTEGYENIDELYDKWKKDNKSKY